MHVTLWSRQELRQRMGTHDPIARHESWYWTTLQSPKLHTLLYPLPNVSIVKSIANAFHTYLCMVVWLRWENMVMTNKLGLRYGRCATLSSTPRPPPPHFPTYCCLATWKTHCSLRWIWMLASDINCVMQNWPVSWEIQENECSLFTLSFAPWRLIINYIKQTSLFNWGFISSV